MIKRASQTLSRLDILAPEVSVNINGQSSVKTVFGAFLSCIATGAFLWMCRILVGEYFNTSKPNIAQENAATEQYPKIDLQEGFHLPMVFVYNNEVTPLRPAQIGRFFTIFYIKYRYLSLESGELKVETVSMPFVPCAELQSQNKRAYQIPGGSAVFKTLASNFGLCVDYDERETYVQGSGFDAVYELTSLEVYPCSLSEGCATKEELAKVGLTVSTIRAEMNLGKYKNPVAYQTDPDNYFYVNPTVGQRYESKLMRTEIYDSRGFLSEESLESTFSSNERVQMNLFSREESQTSCSPEELDDGRCRAYFYFETISGASLLKVTRNYKGMIETFGDIGGIRELVYLLFIYFYSFYNQQVQKQVLVEQVFGLKKPNRLCRRKGVRNTRVASSSPGFSPEGLGPAPGAVFEEAYRIIENSLNIVSIAKEANSLKFISNFLLNEYHRAISPLVALNIELANREEISKINRGIGEQSGEAPQALVQALGFAFKNLHRLIDQQTAYHHLVSLPPAKPAGQTQSRSTKFAGSPLLLLGPAEMKPGILEEFQAELNSFCKLVLKDSIFNPFNPERQKLNREGQADLGNVSGTSLLQLNSTEAQHKPEPDPFS